MAITPDVTTITVDGITIGLSDTIANLIASGDFTIDNLTPYMFCGQSTVGNVKYNSLSGAERSYNGSGASLPDYFPVYNTGSYIIPADTVEYAIRETPSLLNDSYGRNILIHGSLGLGGEPQSIRLDNMAASDMRVVTSINFKKIYYDVEMAAQTVNYNPPSGTASYYATGAMGRVKTVDNDLDTGCFVYSLFGDSTDWYCVKDWMFPASDYANNLWQFSSFQTMTGNYGNTGASILYGFTNFANDKAMSRAVASTSGDVYGGEVFPWNIDGLPAVIDGDFISVCDFHPYAGTCRFYLTGLDNALMQVANAGLKFYWNSTWYKPTASGGYITGYTDDMTEESDWDDITDVTGNIVPVTPPGPTPPGPGPYDDDPWNGVSFSGVGVGGAGAFATCYYMTSTELANLRTWMSGVGVPEGFDPMAQIIGLSQVPVALSGDAPETVKFINSSAVYDPGVTSRVVDSGVNTQQAMGTPIKYSLGSVAISRRMQERGEPYLDYDCQVELYLPLVGVFSLDTQAVMGRTIEAEAILDPVSGTLAAYAWVSKDGQKLPIAYGSTSIGVDLPITAQQYSVAKGALKQANAQLGTALLSSALTMIASASASGKASQSGGRSGSSSSGIQQANNNSFSQAAGIAASQTMVSQTGNVFGSFMDWGRTIRQLSYGNNTAISGSFGGSTAQWSYPFQAYVKIIRPRFEKPDNYAHTQGVPCVQAKKIKNCTGFIQCIGVDVKNIAGATDLERQAIQAALSNGIYAGGGQ